ncbi:unnamed protein product, partial [Ectocarpus sp. 12 AP-2014]
RGVLDCCCSLLVVSNCGTLAADSCTRTTSTESGRAEPQRVLRTNVDVDVVVVFSRGRVPNSPVSARRL